MKSVVDIRWLLQAVGPHSTGEAIPRLANERQASVIQIAFQHRLSALLHHRLNSSGHTFEPDLQQKLSRHASSIAARSLAMTREMLVILNASRRVGLTLVPFKGPLLALQAYGDLSVREFDDLDLLVPRKQLASAARVLESLGYRLDHPTARSSDAVRLLSEYHFPFHHADTGCRVELHAEVAPAGFAKPSCRDMSRRLEYAELGGARIAVLSNSDLIVVLCVHAGKHLWGSLEFLTALVHLIHRRPPDWDEVASLAYASGAERFVALGLSTAREWMGLDVPSRLFKEVEADPAIAERWGVQTSLSPLVRRPPFHLKCHARWPYKIRYLSGAVLAPNWDDFCWLRLPGWLHPFYPFVRLARLAFVQAPGLVVAILRNRRGLKRAPGQTQ